jgi:hypothetical protein
VKKLKYFSLAVLVLSLLAIPATAQKGKDNDKNDNKGKRKGFTQGKHKGRH